MWPLPWVLKLICSSYCKEYSTKTRIVTLMADSIMDWFQYCKEYSTKTRIVTCNSSLHNTSYYYCKEYSTKTRIVTTSGARVFTSKSIAKSILLKQGLWPFIAFMLMNRYLYCKEYSTKTRIVTFSQLELRFFRFRLQRVFY